MTRKHRSNSLFAMLPALLLGAAALFVAGCGGDSSLGGGIGGTGKGTITGYGSIVFNDTSVYDVNDDTEITIDGGIVTYSELSNTLGTGFVANFVLAGDANSDLTSGTLLSVGIQHNLVGPITTAGTGLRVLRQRVLTNAETLLVGITDQAALNALPADSTTLAVSGYVNEDNILMATRIEDVTGAATTWKLTGYASSVVANASLDIGTQAVNTNGVTPDCTGGLNDGQFVSITADAASNGGFTDGSTLAGVTSLACAANGVELPPGFSGFTIKTTVEGLVDDIADPFIWVGDQLVLLEEGDTAYLYGEKEDLVLGKRVRVTGELELTSGILTADTVQFVFPAVRINGPLPAADVGAGQVTVLGIDVVVDDLTLNNADPDEQVQIHGFVDSAGTVYASKLLPAGVMNPNRVSLRGPVQSVPGYPVFVVLGVNVDITDANSFVDADGNFIEEAVDFYGLLATDDQVKVNNGVFDGTDTITAPKVVGIED